MSRNSNSRFANVPQVDIKRTQFDIPINVKTSFNVGELVPFMKPIEVLPGDTFQFKTSKIVRLSTLKCPPMDSLYLDTMYFFVPNRILWKHWVNLMGENTESSWIPETEYSVPTVTSPTGGWNVGTIADFMSIPTGVSNLEVNALPFRGYCKIVDDFFRDENVDDPVSWSQDDATVAGSNGSNYITDMAKGGKPFIANKLHDYFTSCLPGPQKHEDVLLPLGKTAGVYTGATEYPFANFPKDSYGFAHDLKFMNSHDGSAVTSTGELILNNQGKAQMNSNWSLGNLTPIVPSNLYADLSNATAASINQLRLAFQLQKFYERSALYGSRYTETIRGHFGVTSPDARLQRAEYLGGNRITLNITNVAQTSGTGTTPQGNLAAYSQTVDNNGDFIKSFTEHGMIFGLMCVRYRHSYQQGLHKMWSRRNMQDFYWPEFQCLGNMPVLNKEIYCTGVTTGDHNDNDAFAYQEAYAEYRYEPAQITGELRSTYATSLDVWHYGDEYNTLPTLSSSWMKEDKGNVDRSLAVTSAVSNQLIADIFVNARATRPMPLYSVPGLLDHF